MAKALNKKQELAERFPRTTYGVSPPAWSIINYISLLDELERIKQRLAELETKEKVIVLKEITREEAKKEIQQLFKSGRTLYYSDIVQELKLDLEMVVDICNELQESGEIGVDANVR